MDIEVRESAVHGRGVFAKRDFKKGETVEACPVVILSPEDKDLLGRTKLHDYYYEWGEDMVGIAGGCGSFYNHSYDPNAAYKRDPEKDQLIITCLEDIVRGKEITVNYNGKPDDRTPVWFEKKGQNKQ